MSYAKNIPVDKNRSPMQEYPPPYPAIIATVSDNNTTSSVVSLNDNTTVIEVAATGGSAVLRWITTSNTNPSVISAAGTANFDHVIPSNTFRKFVVPKEGNTVTSIVGENVRNGLYRRIAVKSNGAASVLTTEY